MTSAGLKTSSAVYEDSITPVFDPMANNHQAREVMKGQALKVDLPDGPLFVLGANGVGRPNVREAAYRTLAYDPKSGTVDYKKTIDELGRERVKYQMSKWISIGPSQEIYQWPEMVRFRNINDPGSVEKVDPDAVGVRRIWVETTDDPVTTGIEREFPPWFGDLIGRRKYFSGRSWDVSRIDGLADHVTPGDFSTEIQ